MKLSLPILAVAFAACCGLAQAQERAAVGNIQNQLTWSALNGQLANFNSKTNALNSRLDRMILCGNYGMIYAPDTAPSPTAPGIPAGCMDAKGDSGTPTSPDLTQITNYVNSIIGCGASNYFFNGSSCVAAVYAPAASYRWVAAGGGSSSLANCTATVGSSCSSPGAVCKTTQTTRAHCSDNQCGGMGYQTNTSYSRFVCN